VNVEEYAGTGDASFRHGVRTAGHDHATRGNQRLRSEMGGAAADSDCVPAGDTSVRDRQYQDGCIHDDTGEEENSDTGDSNSVHERRSATAYR